MTMIGMKNKNDTKMLTVSAIFWKNIVLKYLMVWWKSLLCIMMNKYPA